MMHELVEQRHAAWRAEGREEGLAEGMTKVLYLQAEARFGSATARRLSEILGEASDADRLAEVGKLLVNGISGEDLLRQAAGK